MLESNGYSVREKRAYFCCDCSVTERCHIFRYTVVTLLLNGCHTVVTMLLQCCYIVARLLLHCCYTVMQPQHCQGMLSLPLVLSCNTLVTILLHCCHTVVGLLLRCCHTERCDCIYALVASVVTTLQHYCNSRVTFCVFLNAVMRGKAPT
jgi:uncharacterized MAPEG superfamily protein